MNIGERLRLIRTKLNLTQRDAATKFNMPVTSWKSYEKGPSEPGSGALRGLSDGGINTNWLLTGKGPMLWHPHPILKPFDEEESTPADNYPDAVDGQVTEQINQDMPAFQHDFALIPVYDVQASAGHGSLVESELQTGQLAFKKSWIKEKGLQIGHLAIITAKGDSMESTIWDGDTLLVDTRVDRIIDDSIYIVQADHHLIVKRLQQDFDGSVFVISDNPRYEKRHLNPEQAKNLKIAGRVCWYGHEI